MCEREREGGRARGEVVPRRLPFRDTHLETPPFPHQSQILDTIPSGASVGDRVIASGNIFDSLAPSATPIGVFDLAASVTSVAGATERRFMFIDLAFSQAAVPFKAPAIALATMNKTANFANVATAPTNDINLSGVVTFPSGGATVADPHHAGGGRWDWRLHRRARPVHHLL